jgi:neutral ceramidase
MFVFPHLSLNSGFLNAKIDTLEAYIDKYTSLVPFLANGPPGAPASDDAPAEQISKAISMQVCSSFRRQYLGYDIYSPLRFQTDVKFDAAPFSKKFGQILKDVVTTPYHSGDTVFTEFVGANPRVCLVLPDICDTADGGVSCLLEQSPS